jgi:hydrogenase nickel incorporation protein HypA/HybF
MHELSLMKTVVDEALRVSCEHGGTSVVSVTLQVGALCQVVPENLDLAFRALTRGTGAEGARLEWSTVPVRVRCEACGQDFRPDVDFWTCPECGERGGRVVEGNELLLECVELAEDDGRED